MLLHQDLLDPTGYALESEEIATPALLIYPDSVDANIRAVLAQCGNASRWRPHVKTAKAADVMARYLLHGITRFKCATSKELRVLLELGASDILVSFPVVGATAQRVRSLANDFPDARIAVLAESVAHVRGFERSGIDFFIDCNPGMDRTGHDPSRPQSIVALARAIQAAECEYRGLHWYDGHLASYPLAERDPPAHAGYDALAQLVETLDAATVRTREVIVAGTPAAPSALSYRWGNVHADVQISPGTVVYNDFTSLEQLPAEWGLQPAALVLTSVISHPRAGRITCDAGHKSVSADAGVPTCVVLGHPDWAPTKPSEEHLPIDIPGAIAPAIGETLLLLPRHICTTVNNFDEALLVRHGMIERAVPVTARGREGLRV